MLPYVVIDPNGETIATLQRPEDVACMLSYYGTGCVVLRAHDRAIVWAADDVVPDDPDDVNESFVRTIEKRYGAPTLHASCH